MEEKQYERADAYAKELNMDTSDTQSAGLKLSEREDFSEEFEEIKEEKQLMKNARMFMDKKINWGGRRKVVKVMRIRIPQHR